MEMQLWRRRRTWSRRRQPPPTRGPRRRRRSRANDRPFPATRDGAASRGPDEVQADLGGAGEADLVQPGVGQQRADELRGPGGGQALEHARRQTRRVDDPDELRADQRRLLGGLDDQRAPGGEREPDLPDEHARGEVPGCDRQGRTDRSAQDEPGAGGRGRCHATVRAASLLGRPFEHPRAAQDLTPGLGERLAALGRQERGQHVGLRPDAGGARPEQAGALLGTGGAPAAGGGLGGVRAAAPPPCPRPRRGR